MEIGIIGAGAAGVSVLDALSLTAAAPGGVTVFDGSPWLWRGRAYQPDLDAVLTNAPPVLMSVRDGDPQHFARWLAARGARPDRWLKVPIVPRAVYGEYLETTAHEAMARLRDRGWRVHVVNDRVTGFDPLRTSGGGVHPVDAAVLCVGGGGPLDHYGLTGSPGFVLEPYPLARTVADVPAGGHVVVVGSGLTAVDVVVSLAASGHTGPITLVSRGGVLPWVQQTPVRLEFQHLTRDQLPTSFAGLVSLARAELAAVGQDLAPLAAEITAVADPVERLRRQLSEVDDSYLGRRLVMAATHLLGSAAWQRLPAADRSLLHRHFRTVTSLASPMVPGNAEILLRLFDSGQLCSLSGVTKIEANGRGFRVFAEREVTADVVVNAVNPPVHAVPGDTEALVGSLLSAGAAALPEGGGLAVRAPGVHTLGGITAGTSFVTPGIATLAAGAGAVVRNLVGGQR